MALQPDTHGRPADTRPGTRRPWAVPVWIATNLVLGLAAYVPLLLGVFTLLHHVGPPGYRDEEAPAAFLGVGVPWLLATLVPFAWSNRVLSRCLPLPRWATWTGAGILLVVPTAFAVLFPEAANGIWYQLFN